jgi:uncharacterized repeat protein (TIGR01451 family)
MKRTSFFAACLGFVCVAAAVFAQSQPVSVPLPAQVSAPLLFVRFMGPKGMRVTFYQGRGTVRAFDVPVTVGIRPGYVYRVKLTSVGTDVKTALYPTLEVRGSLALTKNLQAAEYPAPAAFDVDNLEHALSGTLVTKVVYVEHPDYATPVATKADEPLESVASADRDPLSEARLLGRPVMIVRFGGKQLSDEEMAAESIPNTILFPGEKGLAPAKVGPFLPLAGVPVYDPVLGPKCPEEECLHDGGDGGPKAGFNAADKLAGVDPADSVAEYRDSQGRHRIAVSNRVCICVPRYGIIRAECPLAENAAAIGPGDTQGTKGQDMLKSRTPSLLSKQTDQLAAMKGRGRASVMRGGEGLSQILQMKVLSASEIVLGPEALIGSKQAATLTEKQRAELKRQIEFARELAQEVNVGIQEQITATSVVGRVDALHIVEARAEARDFTCLCDEAPHAPDQPLTLCKWADRQAAQVGDVVTFTLKYSNLGGQPIADVAVADSLTTRLEYVAGSAQSDRNAVFTIQNNEVGSALLRWEVSGRLMPGQSGVVRFQAKIR